MKGSRLLATVSGGALSFAACAATAQQQSTETYQYDALGRVITAKTSGGTNNDETHSICYDAAGNRVKYRTTTNGTAAACASQGTQGNPPAPSPSPSPPPGGNAPPATQSDFASGQCFMTTTVNLTANDTDPEGNYPLVLTSISVSSGFGSPTIISASSVSAEFGPAGDVTVATYTVADSLGAVSTGQLTLTTSGCGGGNEP